MRTPVFIAAILLALSVAIGAFSQSAPPQGLSAIDRILKDAVAQGAVPGAVVFVAGKEKVLY